MRAWLVGVLLAGAGCHLGPFYDVHHVRVGPRGPDVARELEGFVKVGETTLTALLDRAGPPTRLSRRGDSLWLSWGGTDLTRHWYGFGVGAAGFFLQLAQGDRRIDGERRLVCVVRDGVVVGVGAP